MNMQFFAVCVFLCFVVVSLSEVIDQQLSLADYVDKQNKVFSLLYHIHQDSFFEEHVTIGTSWSLAEQIINFKKPDVVPKFLHRYNNGFLTKEEVFTPFYEKHLEQAVALFRLLYYANDWDTFYNASAWARQNVNAGMFIYAFYVAVDHREDCKDVILPPIYEVNPRMFIKYEPFDSAELYKIRYDDYMANAKLKQLNQSKAELKKNVTILYKRLPLFHEDIGVNAMYFYFSIRYPFWMGSADYEMDARRGETFLHFYQQLYARYYLERISTGKDDITEIDFNEVVNEPFYPLMRYWNGMLFPDRYENRNLRHYFKQEFASEDIHMHTTLFLIDYERRIRDAIDTGFALARNGSQLPLYTHEGLNLLGNIIEGNAASPNAPFFGSLMFYARHVLGYPVRGYVDPPQAPCPVEQFETTLRDPIFWKMIKKVVGLYQRYLFHLPPYTQEQLLVLGVNITSVEVDKLIKREEPFDVDLINAVNYTKDENFGDFIIRLRQSRPGPDKFTYKINMYSEAKQTLAFKLFIGPSHNHWEWPIKLSKHTLHMFLLDTFTHETEEGDNVIVRNITDSPHFVQDERTFSDLFGEIRSALSTNTTYDFKLPNLNNTFAWPIRFALPRGSEKGTPFRLFVAVNRPNHAEHHSQLYPFDRLIKDEEMFLKIPNFYTKVENVYYNDEYTKSVLKC